MSKEAFIAKENGDAFIGWLNDNGYPWRAGKGDYQLMQVYCNKVWHPVYMGDKYPNNYKGIGPLGELMQDFNRSL